ncbi:hypothetical protein T440DRAFT_511814 [Plenodomus tracheiphilus IPT5]|uniref:Uncharacterized protein n=1 Tax=Plenodomus tracheiphilus IPT5 TaxID=1408161 RepID=A0A6A7ASM3_9PLEO|nr:hypothetical protein T440DRAFT_511814 [Plenodomus tracheiphilus IPT5]
MQTIPPHSHPPEPHLPFDSCPAAAPARCSPPARGGSHESMATRDSPSCARPNDDVARHSPQTRVPSAPPVPTLPSADQSAVQCNVMYRGGHVVLRVEHLVRHMSQAQRGAADGRQEQGHACTSYAQHTSVHVPFNLAIPSPPLPNTSNPTPAPPITIASAGSSNDASGSPMLMSCTTQPSTIHPSPQRCALPRDLDPTSTLPARPIAPQLPQK